MKLARTITDEELSTILADLRMLQTAVEIGRLPLHIEKIATEHGARFVCDPSEIDRLCQELNCET